MKQNNTFSESPFLDYIRSLGSETELEYSEFCRDNSLPETDESAALYLRDKDIEISVFATESF